MTEWNNLDAGRLWLPTAPEKASMTLLMLLLLLSSYESKGVLVDSLPRTDGDDFNDRGQRTVDDSKPPDRKTAKALEIVSERLSAVGMLKNLLHSSADFAFQLWVQVLDQRTRLFRELQPGGERHGAGGSVAKEFRKRVELAGSPETTEPSPDLLHELYVGTDRDCLLPAFELLGTHQNRRWPSIPRDGNRLIPRDDFLDQLTQPGLDLGERQGLHGALPSNRVGRNSDHTLPSASLKVNHINGHISGQELVFGFPH